MARNHHHLLLALFLVAAAAGTTTTTATSVNSTTPTAYEMLERYEFPRGILPEGVQRYELRPDDGSFEVFLSGRSGSCEFRVGDRYLLRYDRRISGTAREGSIQALQGMSVKVGCSCGSASPRWTTPWTSSASSLARSPRRSHGRTSPRARAASVASTAPRPPGTPPPALLSRPLDARHLIFLLLLLVTVTEITNL